MSIELFKMVDRTNLVIIKNIDEHLFLNFIFNADLLRYSLGKFRSIFSYKTTVKNLYSY